MLLFGLFFLGRTKPHAKGPVAAAPHTPTAHAGLDIDKILTEARKKLTPSQSAKVTALENALSRGDLVTQKIQLYGQLSEFWRDSARSWLPYLWYYGEKAKLEKSEKNLNFAAHSYLEELRGVGDPELKTWMAIRANELFKLSLDLNPLNDSTKVGFGATYFFGGGGDAPPMEGIMQIREVAEKDSTNVFAQFMLGYGGIVSGQLDKATERFLSVIRNDPDNKEAVFLLAETYERQGKKKEAAYWFGEARKKVDNPEVIRAIEEKIKSLQ